MPHRLAAFCPAFTPRDLSHRKAINSDPLFHPKHNRNTSIPLQSLNYFFLEQQSGRIHQWSNETLKCLGLAFSYSGPDVGKTDRSQVPWKERPCLCTATHWILLLIQGGGRIPKASCSPLDPEVLKYLQPQRPKKCHIHTTSAVSPWLLRPAALHCCALHIWVNTLADKAQNRVNPSHFI